MLIEELKQAVIAEATLLKKHATPKELARLNFKTLNGKRGDMCLYAQLVKDSFQSTRAKKLKRLCDPLYSIVTSIEVYVFGEYLTCAFTPKIDVLIQFLKGEIDTLTPEML